MNRYSETQKKVVNLIENKKRNLSIKGGKWKKFYGDMVCRIFMDFISKEISKKIKLVE